MERWKVILGTTNAPLVLLDEQCGTGTSTQDSPTQKYEYQTEHDCDLPDDSECKIVSHQRCHSKETQVQYEQPGHLHLIPPPKCRRKLRSLFPEILGVSYNLLRSHYTPIWTHFIFM